MLDTILRGRSDDVVLINGAILPAISRDVARNIAPYARDDFCYAWRPIGTRLLCWLMKAIVVMHQETHHSGGIPLCILIIPECFAQNLEGIAVVLIYLLCLPQQF